MYKLDKGGSTGQIPKKGRFPLRIGLTVYAFTPPPAQTATPCTPCLPQRAPLAPAKQWELFHRVQTCANDSDVLRNRRAATRATTIRSSTSTKRIARPAWLSAPPKNPATAKRRTGTESTKAVPSETPTIASSLLRVPSRLRMFPPQAAPSAATSPHSPSPPAKASTTTKSHHAKRFMPVPPAPGKAPEHHIQATAGPVSQAFPWQRRTTAWAPATSSTARRGRHSRAKATPSKVEAGLKPASMLHQRQARRARGRRLCGGYIRLGGMDSQNFKRT